MSESTLSAPDRAALADLMASRANVYRLLSRCYRSEMDAVLAREISDEFTFETDNDALAAALGAMRAGLADADEDALEQLAVTFDRVFFGMGPLTARHAFPYESVYTSDKGILMQEAYTSVARTYRGQSLAKDASFTEPEDHLAVELAFMATLADRARAFLEANTPSGDAAAEETLAQSLAFVRAHLLNWIDRFCAELERAAMPEDTGDGGFYAGLARFTATFVAGDAALLEETL